MKTKPIGVRFDQNLLDVFKEDGIADTPQGVLNFLTEFYKKESNKPIKKAFENSKLFNKREVRKESKIYESQDPPQFKNSIERKLWELEQDRLKNKK